MRQSAVTRTVQLAFASAIAILLLVGGFSYRGMRLSTESERLVWHTHQVLSVVDTLRLTMESVTANAHSFVLTGRKFYLDTYRVDKLTAEQAQAKIRELTLDNPQQQRQLSILASLVARRFERADRLIELRKTGGLETAAEALRLNPSQPIIDQIRHVAGAIADTELALLALRDAEAERHLRQTKTVLLLGTVIGVLIAAAAGFLVQRENSRRRFVEQALGESEENYRMLLNGVQGYAIFMIDPIGNVLSWHAGAERIKGYTAEQIIGQNFSCFFPPEDVARGWPAEILRMATASGYYEEQSLRVRRDGSRFL
ncbi:MAG TPA: CHASE3 domain-containing protein, partial [Polyangiaceae bacterium]|nr:CHASE3 domain-containing protein [Polyangiaceae bacterium]